jgi:hypothetical protein
MRLTDLTNFDNKLTFLVNESAFSMSRFLGQYPSSFRRCCFRCSVAPHPVLRRVSIRTVMSCLQESSVPIGVREENRCCYFLAGLNALAVIGTRCRTF